MPVEQHDDFQKWSAAFDRMVKAGDAYREAVTHGMTERKGLAQFKRELDAALASFNLVADTVGMNDAADVIGNAVKVMRIASGEETDVLPTMARTCREGARQEGRRRSRQSMTPDCRMEIAKKAAAKR